MDYEEVLGLPLLSIYLYTYTYIPVSARVPLLDLYKIVFYF